MTEHKLISEVVRMQLPDDKAVKLYCIEHAHERHTAHGYMLRFAALCTCMALLLIGALHIGKSDMPQITPTAGGSTVTMPATGASTGEGITLDLSSVAVNALAEYQGDGAMRYYSPEEYNCLSWNTEDILAYYGRNFVPAYLPDGMVPSQSNGQATAWEKKNDAIVYDSVIYSYYSYDSDGTPVVEGGARKGIDLAISKIGLSHCCQFLLPENEVKPTQIGGVDVTVGYRSMDYGPYDPDTHTPSGYYDLYVVNFTLDGVRCEITATQIPLDEVMRFTASVICGTDNITVE